MRFRNSFRVFLLLAVPGLALAQLVTFTADSPAKAGEVNGNFAQLKSWLEQRTGPVGNSSIDAGTLTADSVTSRGAVRSSSLATGTALLGSLDAGAANVSGNLTVGGTLNVTGAATLNGVRLFAKGGNNGTVSCNAFCAGSNFVGGTGACVGYKRVSSGNYWASCDDVVNETVICLCASY